jgi:Flp pilus assembly protein TadD
MDRILRRDARSQHLLVLVVCAVFASMFLAACGDTGPSAEEHFQMGNEYAQTGEFEKARAEFEAVLEKDPDNVSAMSNLGVVYYQLGRLDDAIGQYTRALELEPEDADIRSNLAAAYVQKDQLDLALQQFQRAVELNPGLAEAYFGLGVVHLQLDNTEAAILAFESFQQHDSGRDPVASSQAVQYLEQLRGQ